MSVQPPDRFGGQEKNMQTFSPLERVVKYRIS